MLRLTLFLIILMVGFSCKKKEFPIPSDEIRCSPEKEVLVTSMEYIDSLIGSKYVLSYQYNLKKLDKIQDKNVWFPPRTPKEEILNTFKIEYPSENKIKIIKNDNEFCNFEINNQGRVDKINYASRDTLYLYYNLLGQLTFTKSNTLRHYLEYSTDNHLLKDSTVTLKNNKWEWKLTTHYSQYEYVPNPMYHDKWIYFASGTGYNNAYIPNGYWQTYPDSELSTEGTGIMRFFVLYQNGMLKYWSETTGFPGERYMVFKYGCF